MDPLLIMMLLAVGAMFLLTNRTRKQQAKANEVRQSLEIGDEVMTGSGLFGTIIDIDGDVITLESPSGAQTDWLRSAIAKLAAPPYAELLDEPDAAGDEDEDVLEEDGDRVVEDRVDDDGDATPASAIDEGDGAEETRRRP